MLDGAVALPPLNLDTDGITTKSQSGMCTLNQRQWAITFQQLSFSLNVHWGTSTRQLQEIVVPIDKLKFHIFFVGARTMREPQSTVLN